MGQVLRSAKFGRDPVTQHPGFTARRVDVCRALAISSSTLHRWEQAGVIWAFDEDHLDGHYRLLPTGRRRYNLDRLWEHAAR